VCGVTSSVAAIPGESTRFTTFDWLQAEGHIRGVFLDARDVLFFSPIISLLLYDDNQLK
jgi:hypothetical protein